MQASAQEHRTVVQIPGTARHRFQPRWVNTGGHLARFEQLRPYFRDRSVLDLGCATGWRRPDWFHGLIASVASETVGVDIDTEAARELSAQGHAVVVADVEDMDLGRQFDVVHAGELIEHLDNPHAFLGSARRHLRADSSLMLTTPNPFCVSNFVYRFGGKPKLNRDHTCWYCEDTLRQLLDRNGFAAVEVRYLHHRSPGRIRAAASTAIRAVLPERLAWNTLFVVAQPAY